METDTKKKSFNKRAFISTAMLLSGLILPFSGIMNHNLQFDKLDVERHFWMTAHNTASILFVIFSILHISLNWKILINYVKKAKETFISKEVMTAVILIIIFVGLISSHAFHVDK